MNDDWFLEILYSLNGKTENQKASIIADIIIDLEEKQKKVLRIIEEAPYLLNANSPEGMDQNDFELKEQYESAQKELYEIQQKIEKLNSFYTELLQ